MLHLATYRTPVSSGRLVASVRFQILDGGLHRSISISYLKQNMTLLRVSDHTGMISTHCPSHAAGRWSSSHKTATSLSGCSAKRQVNGKMLVIAILGILLGSCKSAVSIHSFHLHERHASKRFPSSQSAARPVCSPVTDLLRLSMVLHSASESLLICMFNAANRLVIDHFVIATTRQRDCSSTFACYRNACPLADVSFR